jgi:hypothetical protein
LEADRLNNITINSELNARARFPNITAVCYIGYDHATHSFSFAIMRGPPNALRERDLNGGIILHGYGETFSVEINPKNGLYWSTHT